MCGASASCSGKSSVLRICSFNVNGVYGRSERMTKVASLLSSVSPDVICLQEVEHHSARLLGELLTKESGTAWRHAYADAGYMGNSLLTRHSIVWSDAVEMEEETSEMRSAVRAVVEFPESSAVEGENARVLIVATHLDWEVEQVRMTQMEQLLRADWDRAPKSGCESGFILCGDMNALTRSDYSDREWQDIADQRAVAGIEEPRAGLMERLKELKFRDSSAMHAASLAQADRKLWTTSRFQTRIDYILASEHFGWPVLSYEVVDAQTRGVSDHHLVIADFGLKDDH